MKFFRHAVRAAVLLTTGPPLLAMAACTASTVATLRALSAPAADFRALPAGPPAPHPAARHLPPPDDRSHPGRRFAATVTIAPGGRARAIKASGHLGWPLHVAGCDHHVSVSAYRILGP